MPDIFSYKGSDIFPEPDFPLRVMPVIHPASFSDHTHEFVELVCVISGQGIHKLSRAGSEESLSCGILYGDLFLMRPGDVHSFSCCSKLRLYNIMFMPELVEDSIEALRSLPGLRALYGESGAASLKLHLSAYAKTAFESQARRLGKELSERKPGYRLAAKAGLLELLVMAGRLEPAPVSNSTSSSDERLFRQQLVNKAICLMEGGLDKALSVEELASKLGMSPSHFTRIFKASSGLAPCDYMIRLKLEKAKAMLLDTDLPVASIAFQNGFCDASYLSKLFRKLEGCTPSTFRRKLRP